MALLDKWNFHMAKILTPKVLEAIFQDFLKFGQAIVDAMFVPKISKFLVNMWFSTSFKTH
jgi:hypothetical protein